MRPGMLGLVLILAVLSMVLLVFRSRMLLRTTLRHARRLRRWRPRTPVDCPHCQREALCPPTSQGPAPPRPWELSS
jgi:hypothetical protein